MSRSGNLFDTWSRIGSDMLARLPDVGGEARRMAELGRAPYKLVSEMHEAWLETVGGVSKNRYLAALEENLELRRRLDEAERKLRAKGVGPEPESNPAEAMDGAFKQIREAQDQWMSMWMPGSSGGGRRS